MILSPLKSTKTAENKDIEENTDKKETYKDETQSLPNSLSLTHTNIHNLSLIHITCPHSNNARTPKTSQTHKYNTSNENGHNTTPTGTYTRHTYIHLYMDAGT